VTFLLERLGPQDDALRGDVAEEYRGSVHDRAQRDHMRLLVIAGSFLSLLVASSADAQPRASSVPLLVSTAWLADHLRDPDLVVLWTGQGNRDEALIAGARPVAHESLMTMGSGGHDLLATGDLVATLERAGVSNSSHVVVYGEPLAAGWLFFALDYLGHDRISMLDGGIDKWRAEGQPSTTTAPTVARGSFTPTIRARLKATADEVQAEVAGGRTALLDARTTKEYEAGRIADAKLLTWTDLYADPKLQVFKSRDTILALLRAAGAMPGARAITYCQIGLRSSVLYFAARYAGLDVSNYVGSWSDWSARGLPTERPAPR
jgi:thiosulfate/3-mercaptopyruvate sulfurtransferase